MEIAIASDIHDNLPNLKKFLDFIKKERIRILVLCGDTGNQETLDFLNKNFRGKIYAVSGNLDNKRLDLLEKLILPRLKIAVTHFPGEARKLALRDAEGYDFVFYGHTHKPWLEKIGERFLANPGNLAGILFKATFAVLETKTKKLSLKILEKL